MAVKVNFVMIDFENVQPLKLEKLLGLPVEIRVFLGPQQYKVPLDFAMGLQPFGKQAEYIQLSVNGKNALDFFLSFYLGKLNTENPGAFFHVISKDTDYDPLIAQLRTQDISCQRWEKIEQIPIVKGAPSTPDRVSEAIAFVANPKAPKPRTEAKLRNHLNQHFGGVLAEIELDKIVAAVKAAKAWKERGV